MTEDLDNDELGAVAEAEFVRLCSLAKLACNPSSRDRRGWDFVVEFPFQSKDEQSLDQRGKGTTCHVQVKGTASDKGNRVKLRLSAAEHLAKDPKPALVVVLLMAKDGALQGGYLIQLLGENLAKVLKRLRQAQADDKVDVNHQEITFDYRSRGVRFAATAEGLRSALANACGPDLGAYVVEKQRQLQELGYEAGRFQMDTTFSVAPSELVDVFLGLKPVTVSSLKTYDARFGVRLPVDQFGPSEGAELRFQPHAFDTCEVIVRGPSLSPPAVFKGEALGPPPIVSLHEDQLKLLIRTDAFTLTVTGRDLRFDAHLDLETEKRSADDWTQLFRALSHLATGKGVISVVPGKSPSEPFDVTISTAVSGDVVDDAPVFLRTLERAEGLIALAGGQRLPMTFAELADTVPDIEAASRLLLDKPPSLTFDVPISLPIQSPAELDVLLVNHLSWAGQTLAYAATGKIRRRDDSDVWGIESAEPRDIRPIPHGGFDEYIQARSAEYDMPNIISRGEDA